MDFTRLAVDAGQFINRAVQYTEETLGQAEKTGLDGRLEDLLSLTESTNTWTDQIISQTEVLLQPSPGARLEERLYGRLDWSATPRPRAHEVLGDNLSQAGLEMGPNTPYGSALLKCGEAQKQIGAAERKFVQSTNIHFLVPLRSFTEGEYRTIQDERKLLVNKRLDLDIAKTRLRKAREADAEARNLNTNPLEDDYVAHVSYMFSFLRVKWLKMWAQEISQAEMELRICQSLFDRQSEVTRLLLEGISSTHTHHMRCLSDFVEAQACYYAQCHQHTQELQKQLASIPIVFCSNNWQSATDNTTYQPSASHDVASEPNGLYQVTPIPIVIHQPPDFDLAPEDGPLSGTEPATESSVTMQKADQANYNNSNNNSSSIPQSSADFQATNRSSTNGEISQSPATKHLTETTHLPATSQAADQTLSSHSDQYSSATQITDNIPSTNQTRSPPLTTSGIAGEPTSTNETASQPPMSHEVITAPLTTSGTTSLPLTSSETTSSLLTTSETTSLTMASSETTSLPLTSSETTSSPLTSSGMASETLTTNEKASMPTTNEPKAISSEPQATDGMPSEPQATNETPSEPQATNETPSEPQATNEMPNEPQATNETPSEPQETDGTPGEPQSTNGTPSEPQATNETPSGPQETDGTPGEPQSTNETPSEPQATNETPSEPQETNGKASDPPTADGEDIEHSSPASQP